MDTSKIILFRKLALWLTVLGVGVVTVLFLTPLPDVPETSLPIDKLAHVLLFCALTLPALVTGLARWPVVVVIAALYGLGIEFLQPLTGRSFELADMPANLTGVALALLVAPLLRRGLGLNPVKVTPS